MGSGAKCNQTSCDNPAAFRFTWPGQDEAGVCLEHERRVRQVAEAMGCSVQLIPLQESADPPDPESVKCKNEVLCAIDKSNGLHEDECTTIISRYLQKAREDASERLNRECDVLKESNDKLRDQLCANTKLISELQHTVRLVQETHSQQVHECAVKAAGELVDKFYGQVMDYAFRTKIEAIIRETFGVPVKDEVREEFEKHWANLPKWINQEQKETCFEAFKLAKGDK